MSTDEISGVQSGAESEPGSAEIPVKELVIDVYESAPSAVRDRMLTQLVGQVYESAPLGTRCLLLERLLRPLGVLSLVTVASGIFASVRLRSEWSQLQVNVEDLKNINGSDVVALADYVLQVSNEAINSLSEVISASPVLTTSAAAAVLMVALLRRTHARRATDFE